MSIRFYANIDYAVIIFRFNVNVKFFYSLKCECFCLHFEILIVKWNYQKGANRLAQYETNYRVPRKDLVTEMAKILDVNPIALYEPTIMNAEELMETLFWIDEFNPGMIKLFQLETYPGEKCNSSEDTAVRYHDSDDWPVHPPVGMWFNYGVLNDFLKEWTLRKEELKSGVITRDEYFEWKINWPQTCDDCGKYEPQKHWKKS